ncbi:putative F-box domain, leucine-rich repeat domain, L domain-containing protein [Medicago truncatula]|uniref:Putative F-box domain, leucine-rich repeat domain, L domain-containing protein n=1 Tax=Medicago truncatula TaxID=3880 RepID=A0A396HMS0_MEDTR|nr:F-box/LRR-repeat protein 13-like [Medicago truncatula]RHN53154.1 putative F-box domain, leucine-rich repeat domain, L domain-containing protein [Medicago truncatula]
MTKKKRQKKSDRISELPDHVLLHIIEFMNIRQSVRTCVLSKRWKNVWKSLTNLKLHHTKKARADIFNKFVSQILSGRDGSLPLHSLEYVHDDAVYYCPKTTLLDIMELAASHNVQQVTIKVERWNIKDLELPTSIFNSQSMTFLKLDFRYTCPYGLGKMFPKSLNLPALKTLHLTDLIFTTSDNDNGCIEPFSTCNMLSNLFIVGWFLQDDAPKPSPYPIPRFLV